MAESFDYAATDPGSGGENLCGDRFTQSAVAKFLPAGYLVFGPQDGPYVRVDTGAGLPVEIQNASLAVIGPLTDAELRASAVPVSGTFWQATQPVSGTFWQATQPVSGPLTDVQLRASAVPVSGTFWQATQPVSGPLTDTQLRATAVPVGTELPTAALLADGASLPTTPSVGAVGLRYNGATLDLERGTVEGTALAAASRSASTTSGAITNHNGRGVLLFLHLTSNPSAVGLRVYVEGLDPVSGTWVTLTPAAASGVTALGQYGFVFGPGAVTVPSSISPFVVQATQGHLPRTWHVYVGHAGSGTATYSVGYCLLP